MTEVELGVLVAYMEQFVPGIVQLFGSAIVLFVLVMSAAFVFGFSQWLMRKIYGMSFFNR